jgi:hypothetical protein
MEFGQFEIFQFNGKDCFIKDPDERFTLLSFCEIPDGMHRYLKPGKKLEIIRENAPTAGTYVVKDINMIGFYLSETEDETARTGLLREYVLESAENRKTVFEYEVRPSTILPLKLGQEVLIGNDGLFKSVEKEAPKPQVSPMRRDQVVQSILALEGQKESLPLYARNKLRLLRKELESFRFNMPRKGYTVWSYYDED